MNTKNVKLFNPTVLIRGIVLGLMSLTVLVGCEDDSLPEAGSIPDLTPPSAAFTAAQDDDDFLTFYFANLSNSATDYAWDFGDGNTSTDKDAVNTFPDEGQYTVTLKASDKLGVESVFSEIVVVEEPPAPPVIIPEILEGSFEDNSLPDGTGDGRDSWRNDFGGVIQITSSPVFDGEQAAKFPSAGDRVGYQEIEVTPNTDYTLVYYYTMKEDGAGNVTVTVLNGSIADLSEVADKTLVAHVGTDQTDADTYVRVSLPFNTGNTGTIALLLTNEGVESRVDAMGIEYIAPAP